MEGPSIKRFKIEPETVETALDFEIGNGVTQLEFVEVNIKNDNNNDDDDDSSSSNDGYDWNNFEMLEGENDDDEDDGGGDAAVSSESDDNTDNEDRNDHLNNDNDYDDINEQLTDNKNKTCWLNKGMLKHIEFIENPGLRIKLPNIEPITFFNLIFDNNLLNLIVNQTNSYAKIKRTTTITKNNSKWKNLTVVEFRKFLGLIFHMGTVRLPKINDYWNKHKLFNFDCFSRHMSRNRFFDILHYLHFDSSNSSSSPKSSKTEPPTDQNQDEDDSTTTPVTDTYHKSNKIHTIIDYFNYKMNEIYIPHRELIIDESVIPWKGGRLNYELPLSSTTVTPTNNGREQLNGCINKQKKKYKKNHIKLHVLTESQSDITLFLKINDNKSVIKKSEQYNKNQLIMNLLQNYLNKGYSIYMNDYYSSIQLTELLLNNQTYCTALVRKYKKDNCLEIINAKLQKGEVIAKYKNDIIIMGKFKTLKNTEIYFISSEIQANLINYNNKIKKCIERKPLILHKYTKFMNKLYNKRDKMLSYYSFYSKNLKWYIKLWINIMELLLLNTFIIYKKYCLKKINYYEFRLIITEILLFDKIEKYNGVVVGGDDDDDDDDDDERKDIHNRDDGGDDDESNHDEDDDDDDQNNKRKKYHLPHLLPRGPNNRIRRRRCRVCYQRGKRSNTSYYCPNCKGTPGLCVENCFEIYHKGL